MVFGIFLNETFLLLVDKYSSPEPALVADPAEVDHKIFEDRHQQIDAFDKIVGQDDEVAVLFAAGVVLAVGPKV